MKKIIFLLSILSFSFSAVAGWTSHVNVSEIIAEGGETGTSFSIGFTDSVSADTGTCSGLHHYLNAATEKGKMQFSMFLTAKATGGSVRLTLQQGDRSTSRCEIIGVRM